MHHFFQAVEAISESEFLTEMDKSNARSIIAMFPNVDPYYLMKEIAKFGANFRIDRMTEELAKGIYPTFKDRLILEQQKRLKAKYANLEANFDVAEFLRIFQDPESYFMDTNRPVGQLYRE